jgi:hypothetical protein
MGSQLAWCRSPRVSPVIVEIREARECPAMFDAYDALPNPSRQHRSAVPNPSRQANRMGQFDESVPPFRDMRHHSGLPFVRGLARHT